MRRASVIAGVALAATLTGGAWVLIAHGDWLKRAPGTDEEEKVETEVPVRVARVVRAPLHRYVDGYGTVIAEPAHDGKPAAGARLASPVAGVLAQASCAEGDHVEKGALLFQLDARAATAEEQKAGASEASASAALVRLRAAADYAEHEHERTRRLQHDGLASEKDLRDAELRALTAKNDLVEARAKTAEAHMGLAAAQTQRSLLSIRAPISGTVVRIYVNPGEAVDINPSTILADIVDLDRLVVAATLPAAELPSLKLGQPAELFVAEKARDAAVATRAGESPARASYRGELGFIGLQVDSKTDTAPVRIAVPRDASLRPGQYLRIRIAVEERADCFAVPVESAVAGPDGGMVVAIVEGDKAVQMPVQIGLREGGLIEVRGEGIKEGTRVVAAGAYGLPKETKVRVIGE
jgi:membrane fusion protein (multidrug efflux system)